MAYVYLPMGYPQQSGAEFSTIIYQGNVVRLYELPADPRTTDQLFQRRFLSDTSKLRATLGSWGKGAARTSLGSKWAAVVYQLIKADDGDRWSEAEALWNDAGLSNQNAWREAAPYQATFNDPSKIFYCYLRVLVQVLALYSGMAWESELWDVTQSADALSWWNQDLSGAFGRETVEEDDAGITYVGTWGRDDGAPNGGLHGGYYMVGGGASVNSAEFYFYGRFFKLGYSLNSNFSTVAITFDGGIDQSLNQYGASWLAQQTTEFDLGFRSLHHVRLETLGNSYFNIDYVAVR